jgi:hypothetical protein
VPSPDPREIPEPKVRLDRLVLRGRKVHKVRKAISVTPDPPDRKVTLDPKVT